MAFLRVGMKIYSLGDLVGVDLDYKPHAVDCVRVLLPGNSLVFTGRGAVLLRNYFQDATSIDGVEVIDVPFADMLPTEAPPVAEAACAESGVHGKDC